MTTHRGWPCKAVPSPSPTYLPGSPLLRAPACARVTAIRALRKDQPAESGDADLVPPGRAPGAEVTLGIESRRGGAMDVAGETRHRCQTPSSKRTRWSEAPASSAPRLSPEVETAMIRAHEPVAALSAAIGRGLAALRRCSLQAAGQDARGAGVAAKPERAPAPWLTLRRASARQASAGRRL
ncbi:hypothetical protein ACU4GD_23770 [Cupriavidus basilensis]